MWFLFLAFVLLWSVGAVADFDAGYEAYKRGDYATAMALTRTATDFLLPRTLDVEPTPQFYREVTYSTPKLLNAASRESE